MNNGNDMKNKNFILLFDRSIDDCYFLYFDQNSYQNRFENKLK